MDMSRICPSGFSDISTENFMSMSSGITQSSAGDGSIVYRHFVPKKRCVLTSGTMLGDKSIVELKNMKFSVNYGADAWDYVRVDFRGLCPMAGVEDGDAPYSEQNYENQWKAGVKTEDGSVFAVLCPLYRYPSSRMCLIASTGDGVQKWTRGTYGIINRASADVSMLLSKYGGIYILRRGVPVLVRNDYSGDHDTNFIGKSLYPFIQVENAGEVSSLSVDKISLVGWEDEHSLVDSEGAEGLEYY